MSKLVATKLKRGQAIESNGETGVIQELVHRTPGKGNALVMATVRLFGSGKTKDIRFNPSDKVEVLMMERRKLEFSYKEGSAFHFMDPDDYEMIEVPSNLIEDVADLITENVSCEIVYVAGAPVSVDLPPTVTLEVTESPEGIKGDTANNPQKPATVETGKVIQVPLFVKTGDRIVVDTRTGKYLGRD